MVCIGVYLFWEPSYGRKPTPPSESSSSRAKGSGALGQTVRQVARMTIRPTFLPTRGLRIYRVFAFVGALFGFVISKLVISNPYISNEVSPSVILWICVAIGSFLGYILPRVAENYIVVLGPPVTVVLTYEYLLYERDIDLLELVVEIPLIPEISHSLLSGFFLVSTTFLTLTFRMYLRQAIPILMSGLLSGGLIGNGASIIQSRSFPLSSAEIEFHISAIVAMCSITSQIYARYYRRERGIKKQKVEDRERRLVKRSGDLVVLRCPSCNKEARHVVVTRKVTERGVELMVNCRWLNQFDEACNFHHTVIESTG
jgi:hypothetical protein